MIRFQNMDQTAGNSWSNPAHAMLHETISSDASLEINFSNLHSMFDEIENQMRESESEFQNSIESLREKFVFKNSQRVEHFIRTHRVVAPLLLEAAGQFAKAFKNKAPLSLEIMAEEEPPHSIYALAIWEHDSAEARSALRIFDEGWLAENLRTVNGRIVFDYELI